MFLYKMSQKVRVGLHGRAIVAEEAERAATIFLHPSLAFVLVWFPLDDPGFLLDGERWFGLDVDLVEGLLHTAFQDAQLCYLLQDILFLPAKRKIVTEGNKEKSDRGNADSDCLKIKIL